MGHLRVAEAYFRSSLATDLTDTRSNTKDGVHVANAASVWATLVMGFGGFSDYDGFRLDPHLPPGWSRLRFQLRLRDSVVRVVVTPEAVDLRPVYGPPVELTVYGKHLVVDSPVVILPEAG